MTHQFTAFLKLGWLDVLFEGIECDLFYRYRVFNLTMKFRGKMTETICMRQFASKFGLQGVLFGSLCSHNL
jgi:hypothetical protein